MTTTGITVTGTGTASASPDTAHIRLAAESIGPSVRASVDAAGAALAAMRSALIEHGVEASDLRSSGVSVHAAHHDRGPRRFVARLGLEVTCHDPDASGSLAEAAMAAAGDAARLDGLSFRHSDPAGLRSQARERAMADARRAAEELAALAYQDLGAIEEIVESAGPGGPPVPVRFAEVEAAGIPVNPGKQDVTTTLTVRWAWA